jgi:bifunctional UDP-N-acetylglucosamine pyrophosphorylase/glucosamine-1-phosphate N-acetyltransferase
VPLLGDDGTTLILNGDVPLIETATARALVAACDAKRLALLTVELADPSGYGRIVRHPAGRDALRAAASTDRRRQGRQHDRSRDPRGLLPARWPRRPAT